MNIFFRRSINEYQKQIGLKESFAIQTERLQGILKSIKWTNYEEPPTDRRALRRRAALVMLFPVIEIAWADGRITRRELNAIRQIAKNYGLTDEVSRGELLENLTSRPIPETIGRRWEDLRKLLEKLPALDRESVAYTLTVQAQFVAEQSSDNLPAFLRGERVSQSEREMLNIVAEQLKNALAAVKLSEDKRSAVFAQVNTANKAEEKFPAPAPVASDYHFNDSKIEEYGKLVPLIPLVKTAWAEGRVTNVSGISCLKRRHEWASSPAQQRTGS